MQVNHICFLTYLSRSGSTLLASLLDQYEDISVGIEVDIPDGLINGKCFIKNERELESYLDKVYSSNKFKFWDIERNNLKTHLLKKKFPLSFNKILYSIMGEYFSNSNSAIWIHKNGHYLFHIDRLRKEFEGCKIIFIDRDPRAIFNSQKRAIDSSTRKQMVKSPAVFTHIYLKSRSQINKYKGTDYFHIIDYENLVTDHERELNKLLNFLGVSTDKKSNSKTYMDKIPDKQKHLHSNVNFVPRVERIQDWQDKLSYSELYFLTSKLAKYLKRLPGQDLPKFQNIRPLKLMYWNIQLLYRKTGYRLKTLVGF